MSVESQDRTEARRLEEAPRQNETPKGLLDFAKRRRGMVALSLFLATLAAKLGLEPRTCWFARSCRSRAYPATEPTATESIIAGLLPNCQSARSVMLHRERVFHGSVKTRSYKTAAEGLIWPAIHFIIS